MAKLKEMVRKWKLLQNQRSLTIKLVLAVNLLVNRVSLPKADLSTIKEERDMNNQDEYHIQKVAKLPG